jgi:hypothetical protein
MAFFHLGDTPAEVFRGHQSPYPAATGLFHSLLLGTPSGMCRNCYSQLKRFFACIGLEVESSLLRYPVFRVDKKTNALHMRSHLESRSVT